MKVFTGKHDHRSEAWLEFDVSFEEEIGTKQIQLRELFHLISELRIGSTRLVEGWLEIPPEIGRVTFDQGWLNPLVRAHQLWERTSESEEMPFKTKVIRKEFVHACVSDFLDDAFLTKLTNLLQNEKARTSSFPEEAAFPALTALDKDLWGMNLPCPKVPQHVVPYLQYVEYPACLLTLGSPIDLRVIPSVSTDEEGDNFNIVSDLGQYFRDRDPDYFVSTAIHANPTTSWRFISRGGGVFTYFELLARGTESGALQVTNSQASFWISEFNRLVAPLQDRGKRSMTVGLGFNEARGDAYVIANSPPPNLERGDLASSHDLPPGWRYVVNLEGQRFEIADFQDLQWDPSLSEEVQAALELLLVLTQESNGLTREDPCLHVWYFPDPTSEVQRCARCGQVEH